ncbi:MAG: Spy/CpxP family protein refolding chaperone [Nitrospira sp.]|nr:Spy/CpxP family protein refolding chaperone [Nitrospira sp.]
MAAAILLFGLTSYPASALNSGLRGGARADVPALAGHHGIVLVDMMGMQPQQQAAPASPAPQGGGMPSGSMQGGSMPGGGMMMDDKMAMPSGQTMTGSSGNNMGGSMMTAPDCCMPNMGTPNGAMPNMGMMPMMQMMQSMQRTARSSSSELLDRFNGRMAFLKAELGITPAQEQAWSRFEQALRSGRQHLLESRQALANAQGQTDVQARLAAYEHHLAMRLDAERSARESFNQLYGMLDDAQKRTANELAVPFLEAI